MNKFGTQNTCLSGWKTSNGLGILRSPDGGSPAKRHAIRGCISMSRISLRLLEVPAPLLPFRRTGEETQRRPIQMEFCVQSHWVMLLYDIIWGYP